MIGDNDLIMHTKFKHPGAVSSGEVTINVTAAAVPNGGSKVYSVSIPKDNTQFSSAQVYLQDPSDSTVWYRTPDLGEYPPDYYPASVVGIMKPTELQISVIYRNSFGGTVNVAAKTIKVKYFLFK